MSEGPRRLGVVADTHCPEFAQGLPPALVRGLEGVELIIHCGDVGGEGGERTLAELERLAPVRAVRGDHDRALPFLPERIELEWAGIRIGVRHGNRSRLLEEPVTLIGTLSLGRLWPRHLTRRWLAGRFPEADLVVYGHTHRARLEHRRGQTQFNPGAVYVVSPAVARERLAARPDWFSWLWLQVIRHRRDRPVASFGIVEAGPQGWTCRVVNLD